MVTTGRSSSSSIIFSCFAIIQNTTNKITTGWNNNTAGSQTIEFVNRGSTEDFRTPLTTSDEQRFYHYQRQRYIRCSLFLCFRPVWLALSFSVPPFLLPFLPPFHARKSKNRRRKKRKILDLLFAQGTRELSM
jgi:hypothetical protein